MGKLDAIHATLWVDNCLGGMPLHLTYANPEEAIKSAQSIYVKGGDKVSHVRAVTLTPENNFIHLWPEQA